MFSILAGRTGLGVAPDQVVAIIESINSPNIAVPGHGTEPAKCFLVGVRNPSGNFSLYIYLLLVESNLPVIFANEGGEVPLEHYPSIEGTAIQFAESMGFMLDNLNFRGRPPHEQAELVRTLPIFMNAPPPRERQTMSQAPAPVAPPPDTTSQPSVQATMPPTSSTQIPGPATQPPTRQSVFPPNEMEALGRLLGAF